MTQPPEDLWIEDEPLEAPQNSFISIGRLGIANFGLPEYEIVQRGGETAAMLTLLRAVNYLGAGGHANTIIGGPAHQTLSERIGESILRGGLASKIPMPGWLREHFERAAG